MRLSELAGKLGSEWRGNGEEEITGVSSIEQPEAGTVTLAADATRLAEAAACAASALIVPPKLAEEASITGRNLIVSRNPKLAFARAIGEFYARPYRPLGVSPDLVLGEGSSVGEDCSIHPRVVIGRGSRIGDRVRLHPGVVIGDNVAVGDETEIFANVSIYDGCEIGARCRIHSGTVIGADGFSFTPDESGRQYKLLQVGRVVIEDDVEIGANCCVDRAGFGETRIRRGAKFDNLIQIGHNVRIGAHTAMAGCVGVAGSTSIGAHCTVGGAGMILGHLTLVDGVHVSAASVVTRSILQPGQYTGFFPIDENGSWEKNAATLRHLHALRERIKALEKHFRQTQKANTP